MDDSTFQIAISLHLGLAFCKPHCFHHCGCEVTAFATHGLSCVQSQGCYHRHSSLNYIFHRALGASRIPSRLEPSGISRSDGKRLDGATLVPWRCGKLLVWDATCVDTLLYGMQHVWTPYCMECNMCGHLIVWGATCVDTLLYGMQHVWTPYCMGCNMCGHLCTFF